MEKKIYPIKSESYPLLAVFIITLLGGIILVVQSVNSILYLLFGLLLIIVSFGVAVSLYKIMSSYISISKDKILYQNNNERVEFGYDSLLEITKAYPNKRIFVNKKELYEITVIKIVSKNTKDILFHYISGPPVKSVKDINSPYTMNSALDKGMWISRTDAMQIIEFVKNKCGSSQIK